MNKFLLSFLVFLGSVLLFVSAAPTRLPSAAPTRSAEQILAERTFGHKITDHEYGAVVIGILVSFAVFITIIYFVFNAMKA